MKSKHPNPSMSDAEAAHQHRLWQAEQLLLHMGAVKQPDGTWIVPQAAKAARRTKKRKIA